MLHSRSPLRYGRALRAGALLGALLASAPALGAVARGQQARFDRTPLTGLSGDRRDALNVVRRILRFVTTAQEAYFAEQRSYTTDVAALRRALRNAWGDSVQVEIQFAGARGWSATATHQAASGRSCVIFVGPLQELPALPTTFADRRTPQEEGVPVCDDP